MDQGSKGISGIMPFFLRMTIAGLARDITVKSMDDTRSSLAYCASGLLTLLI